MKILDVSGNTSRLVMASRTLARAGFVVHTTDGVDSLRWLQGTSAASGKPASADYLVRRGGETFKLIPEGYWGFHAGVSSLTSGSNEGSTIGQRLIGIEIENADSRGEVPRDLQYQAVAEIIRRESHRLKLSPPKIYGHANIALPFGRRSDPVRFDWGLLFHYCQNPTGFMLQT